MANRLTKGKALVGKIVQRYAHATPKVAKVALDAGDENDIAFAWGNPENTAIIVTRVLVDITTAGGTEGAALNIGTAEDDETESDNLIDGLDANATGLADNISDGGTNGKSCQRLDAKGGDVAWITGTIVDEKADKLAGNVYVEYIPI